MDTCILCNIEVAANVAEGGNKGTTEAALSPRRQQEAGPWSEQRGKSCGGASGWSAILDAAASGAGGGGGGGRVT